MKRGVPAVSSTASRIWRMQKFRPLFEVDERVVAPDVVANLDARDDLAAAPDEQLKDFEGLRRQLDALAALAQLSGCGVEFKHVEPQYVSGITHANLRERSVRIHGSG